MFRNTSPDPIRCLHTQRVTQAREYTSQGQFFQGYGSLHMWQSHKVVHALSRYQVSVGLVLVSQEPHFSPTTCSRCGV